MNTLGKVVDATVILGSVAIGYGAIKTIMEGSKLKSGTVLALGGLTLLISIYAFREAVQNIND